MKLSVAMITYNHERFIAQALESALTQKVNFDYEIVVGEDCSTDGTRAIVSDFQGRYPDRIRAFLRDRNLGPKRNFAATAAACQGKYVALLEGDDYWISRDKLQTQVDFLDAHSDWAICCTRAMVRSDLSNVNTAQRVPNETIFPARLEGAIRQDLSLAGLLPTTPRAPGTYTAQDLLMENFIPTCTAVYRWPGFTRFPSWFTRSALGDLPLHVMVAADRKIELLDDCTAVYRLHAGGMWSSRDRLSQMRANTRMLSDLSNHLGRKYSRILKPSVARSYLDFALAARSNGKRVDTGKNLLACLRNGGWRLPVSKRLFAGLAAYTLIGSSYKIFSRANSVNQS